MNNINLFLRVEKVYHGFPPTLTCIRVTIIQKAQDCNKNRFEQNMDAEYGRWFLCRCCFLHLFKDFDTVDHHLTYHCESWRTSISPVLPPSGLDRISQTGHKSHHLEMLTLQWPKCLSGHSKAVYWDLYSFLFTWMILRIVIWQVILFFTRTILWSITHRKTSVILNITSMLTYERCLSGSLEISLL